MSFQDYDIKREYRSQETNIVQDFYLPLMHESVNYQRAVGFFSSTALACYSYGITEMVKNGGHIEIVASPRLSEEDLEAIKTGYEKRDEIIQKCLLESLTEPVNKFEEARLNLLANLIADGKLEIKIAFVDNGKYIGIYHEKLGILYDSSDNVVSFTGSMNESENALEGNYETIDVFCSWKDPDRVQDKIIAFQKIWNNKEAGVVTMHFESVEEEVLKKYKRDKTDNDFNIDIEQFHVTTTPESYLLNKKDSKPTMKDDDLRTYQLEAIQEWEKNNFKGIFDMCTGAGKTYTAIGALAHLYEHTNGKAAVIIVVPFQHLVDQWVEDLEKYNIHPVIGYSSSKNKGYRKKLRESIFDYNLGVKKFICFICTNATFAINEVQNILGKIKENKTLVVDEAHNFGAKSLLKTLLPSYKYRLALSATLDRYGDQDGTEKLHVFFGKKCIEYPLSLAISQQNLTEYYYRPHVVYLTANELEEYKDLSIEIKKYIKFDKDGKIHLSEGAKLLAIKRSRIIAGAINKVELLKELIEPYKNKNSILVYCGATKLLLEDIEDPDINVDIRQIEYITKVLGQDLGMNVARFTSEEDAIQRKGLIEEFKRADHLQALIAIKCLDEGVNIPSIKTAFIMASTTNPKEYIQRRGRVLRTFPGKEYAEIYDMVTLPRPLSDVDELSPEDRNLELSLIKNELNRLEEFRKDSLNPYDSNTIIDAIKDAYGLYDFEKFEDIEEYFFEEGEL